MLNTDGWWTILFSMPLPLALNFTVASQTHEARAEAVVAVVEARVETARPEATVVPGVGEKRSIEFDRNSTDRCASVAADLAIEASAEVMSLPVARPSGLFGDCRGIIDKFVTAPIVLVGNLYEHGVNTPSTRAEFIGYRSHAPPRRDGLIMKSELSCRCAGSFPCQSKASTQAFHDARRSDAISPSLSHSDASLARNSVWSSSGSPFPRSVPSLLNGLARHKCSPHLNAQMSKSNDRRVLTGN